ncbi:hypothetical protein OAA39_00130 [bacterium]|nr:hypothetical protein [bacterium]
MPSLQELKNKLSLNKDMPTSNFKKEVKVLEQIPTSEEKEEKPKANLEIEEARYLLSLIAKSEFSGKDIQIVYDSALKLQEIIKSNLE